MRFRGILGSREKGWAIFIGPDIANSDCGLTLLVGPLNDDAFGHAQWKHHWRLNIRWPLQISNRARKRMAFRRSAVVLKP